MDTLTEEEITKIDKSMNELIVRVYRLPQDNFTRYLINDVLSFTSSEFVSKYKQHSLDAIVRIEYAVDRIENEHYKYSYYYYNHFIRKCQKMINETFQNLIDLSKN